MAITRRGRVVAGVAGAVCVLTGLLTVRGSLSAGGGPATPTAQASAAEPLLSVRRAPELWRDQVTSARLRAALGAAVPTEGACVAVSVGGRTVGAVDADEPHAPASTMKILTAVAALDVLGPDHRFVTELRGPEPDESGVVRGDVVLVGGGDPTLATPRFVDYVAASDRFRGTPLTEVAEIVDQLDARGVTAIDGAIVGDTTRYLEPAFLPTWKPTYRTEGQVGPIAALNVNHGFGELTPPYPVDDPAGYAARQLETLLERVGIDVADGGRAAEAAAGSGGALLARLESPRVADIVAAMLTSSDNTIAEMLVREIAIASKRPATTTDGVAVVLDVLARRSVSTADAAPLDGSGLSPGSRLTCTTLLDTVDLADATVDDGLADAGESGTLALRWVGTPYAGTLHAKTGQLNGVVGLAGYLEAAGDRPELRFAFLAAGAFDTDGGHDLQDAVVAAVATYPDAPSLADLGFADPGAGDVGADSDAEGSDATAASE